MINRVQSISSPVAQPAVQLNLKAISKLREESEHLQERLVAGTEEEQEQLPMTPLSELTPAVSGLIGPAPEVDEDWQIIFQQWKPEHWEIIRLLYQEQFAQLATVARKVHRQVSQLIDEVNDPVAEQLDDLLIDPDTQTVFSHLHEIVEELVQWYFSSKGR